MLKCKNTPFLPWDSKETECVLVNWLLFKYRLIDPFLMDVMITIHIDWRQLEINTNSRQLCHIAFLLSAKIYIIVFGGITRDTQKHNIENKK